MLSSDCLLSPHSKLPFPGTGSVDAANTTFSSFSFGLGGECGLGQIQSPRAWPQSSLGRPGLGRLASSSRRSPAPCRSVPIPRSASSSTAFSGIKPIPGPHRRLRLALGPAHGGAPGHGRGGQAEEGKEASAGAAEPEAAAFVGRSCVLPRPGWGWGRGEKTQRDPGRENGVRRDPVAGPGADGRRGRRKHGIHRPPLLPATAFGNGTDTHMAALSCKDLALSVLSALPGLLALQLLLSPRPAPAPPSAPPPRPAGPHLLRSPPAPAPLRGAHSSLRLRELPGRVVCLPCQPACGETEGRPKVSAGTGQASWELHADLKTGVGGAREPLLLASYPDLCSSKDLRPPSCHHKQVLGADTESWGGWRKCLGSGKA